MIQRLLRIIEKIKLIKKVDQLNIKDSGIDNEGDHYVVLSDDTFFFGNCVNLSTPTYLYHLLSRTTKSSLKKECLQVAIDIVVRYIEQGLKYGGPKKMSRYQVKPGDKIAEMGGYQGFCSIKLAQQVGVDGVVVVIEAMYDNYRLLEKNKKINKLEQMILINKGVWDSKDVLTFNRRDGDAQSSSISLSFHNEEQFSINVDTLDNLFFDVGLTPDDFMIIQLNGAELNALKGLTSFKPKNLSIAARYDSEGKDSALLIKDELLSRGYQVEIEQDDFVFGELMKSP